MVGSSVLYEVSNDAIATLMPNRMVVHNDFDCAMTANLSNTFSTIAVEEDFTAITLPAQR